MKSEILKLISSNLGKIIKEGIDSAGKGSLDRKKIAETIVDFVTDSISKKKGGNLAGSSLEQERGQGYSQGKGRNEGSCEISQ
nr:hypothetical protein [Desulfobulbaceae bacterium]